MSLLDPTPKHRAIRFLLWGLGITTSAGLVGFYSGNALRSALVICAWIPLLAPAILLPQKPSGKR